MLNKIWISFILTAFVATAAQSLFGNQPDQFSEVMTAVSDMAKLSVEIALGLIGVLAFWMGMFAIAENAGMIERVSRLVAPFLHKIMPDVPKEHPAMGSVTMNMAANFLGLDNAATPFGIKAMKDLQSLNPSKDIISNSQIMFLVLNTSSVTLFPIAVFLYRAEQGAQVPTDVFIPILLATSASTLTGLLVTSWYQKINLLQSTVLVYLSALFAFISALMVYFVTLPATELATQSGLIANSLLMTFIALVLIASLRRGNNAYDEFIQGAKQGFDVAINLIPFLLAMLIAIAMLRASGVIDWVVHGIASGLTLFGLPTQFIDALPTALMKPLSGSGARAMMIETMSHHGADSFAGRVASVMQGSTETTFYVLAVYLGAVGVKHIRYTLSCCLAADAAGITAAIIVSYWFFS